MAQEDEATRATAVISAYLKGELVDGKPVTGAQAKKAQRVISALVATEERAVNQRARELGYKGAADMMKRLRDDAKGEQ